MTSGLNRRDLPWSAFLTASFAFGLAVSWQRWGSPLVDRGREMNQPLRLAGGEMLYSDVRHIYGPLSPYLHSALFRLFGASLNVLYADGIITAALILMLVYWLARQLMSPAAAGVATASVMWLCVFRQAGGNYILPYSYSALHGSALGLMTLAILVASLRGSRQPAGRAPATPGSMAPATHGHRHGSFLLAGICAGLATLAKTEMGFAALISGITAAVLVAYPSVRRGATLASCFLAPAVTLIVGVYVFFVLRVGWHTLSADSWLLLRNLPPELVYFNKRISGFDRPGASLWQMFAATVKLGMLAATIAASSWIITRIRRGWESRRVPLPEVQVTDIGRAHPAPLWPLLASSLSMLLLAPLAATLDWDEGFAGSASRQLNALWSPLAATLDWDKGPYFAMPLMLAGLLIVLLVRFRQAAATAPVRNQTIVLIVCSVYALASLARVILRVRTDDSYSSYLLPASVLMFTYCWAQPFAALFTDGQARQLARNIALGFILADVTVAASVETHRFRNRTTIVPTVRGTIIATPDVGQAWNEALAYIKQHTTPADAIAVMPEGTSLNFFSGRRNPLREEILTPGYLDAAAETRAIRQLRDADTRLILITNRPTREFGAAVFGRDYFRHLMRWVEENYEPFAMFGPDKSLGLQIGNPTFFIRAYRRKPNF